MRDRIAAASIVMLVGLGGIAAVLLAGQWARGRADAFAGEMTAAVQVLEGAEQRPAESISAAHQHFGQARRELAALEPFIGPVVGAAERLQTVPVVGRPAQRVVALWTLADAGSSLGEQLTAAAETGGEALRAGVAAHGLVAAAPEIRHHLGEAAVSLNRTQAARIALGDVGWPFERVQSQLVRWDAVAPTLSAALAEGQSLAATAPAALGESRPMTYLILMQTEDDLRATGGFITSVGTIRVDTGKIVDFTFEKVYAAEGIDVPSPDDAAVLDLAPPAPLARYMGLSYWNLRDANWWADFPTSARLAADFWEAMHGVRVDGVVAVNERALAGVIDGLGGVQLADGTRVTAATLKPITLERVFRGDNQSEWYAAQTALSQELARGILAAVDRFPAEQIPELIRRLQPPLNRRDILVAGFEPTVATVLRQYRLDGSLLGDRGDSLAIVEQNVSYAKLSPFISQSLEYTVELDAQGRPLLARLVVNATNTYTSGAGDPGYPAHYYDGLRWNPRERRLEGREGFYGGYTRLLVPAGSRVTGASGFDEGPSIGEESGRTVIGGYVAMQMGAQRRLQVEWSPRVQESADGRYQLLVQRQPGALDHPLTIRVVVPEGFVAEPVDSADVSVQAGQTTWRTTLDQDRALDIRVRPADTARVGALPIRP